MIVAGYLLAALVLVGLVLWLLDKHGFRTEGNQGHDSALTDSDNSSGPAAASANPGGNAVDEADVCCGQHEVCDRESLIISSDQTEYYDDEELDRFSGRAADEYSDEEIEEFRDVMLTLQPRELAGWGRSIQLRQLTLPSTVRDEFLLLISEYREAQTGVRS